MSRTLRSVQSQQHRVVQVSSPRSAHGPGIVGLWDAIMTRTRSSNSGDCSSSYSVDDQFGGSDVQAECMNGRTSPIFLYLQHVTGGAIRRVSQLSEPKLWTFQSKQ
jgi:hypothetical protein